MQGGPTACLGCMLGATAWGPMTSSVIFIHCSGRPLSTDCLAPHATQPTPLPAAACRRLGPSSPRTACASHSRRGPPKPIDNSSSQDFQQLILQATQAHQSAFATASALSLGINLSGTLFQPGKRGRGASRAKITEGATSSSSPFQDDPAATKPFANPHPSASVLIRPETGIKSANHHPSGGTFTHWIRSCCRRRAELDDKGPLGRPCSNKGLRMHSLPTS